MVESAPPRQSVVRLFLLFFVVVCARDFFLIFSRAQKYWRETHLLLDPLTWTYLTYLHLGQNFDVCC